MGLLENRAVKSISCDVASSMERRGLLLWSMGDEEENALFISTSGELLAAMGPFRVSSRHSQWVSGEQRPQLDVAIVIACSTHAHPPLDVQLPHPMGSGFESVVVL